MRIATVLFLIGLVTVCSALNSRTYKKYEKMFGANKEVNDLSFLELSKKQEPEAAAPKLDITSILQDLETIKTKYPSKVDNQKKEFEEAYKRCMSSLDNSNCDLQKSMNTELVNYEDSNKNISDQIKANQDTIKTLTEQNQILEDNYTKIFKDNDEKITKFERDVYAIDTVLNYVKNVHIPTSTETSFVQKQTSVHESALAELGSKIYDAADYITRPVGDMLLKFANIFLQTHQDGPDVDTENPSGGRLTATGSAKAGEGPSTDAGAVSFSEAVPNEDALKPSEKKVTEIRKKIQDILLSLRGKILNLISERKDEIKSAQDYKQPIVDENTNNIYQLDITNKKLQSQADEQAKLIDEYTNNIKICVDIAVQKGNCDDIRKAGTETMSDYQLISDLFGQSQDEIAKLLSAASLG